MFELLSKAGRERWSERRARRREWAKVAREFESKGLSPGALLAPSGGRALASPLDVTAVVEKRFKLSSWVYGCVRLRAQSLASVPFKVERRVRDDEYVPLEEEHPLNELLGRKANKHWTFTQLAERVQMVLDLEGEAYILKLRVHGAVAELWTFLPGQVAPVTSDTEFVEAYEITTRRGRKVRVPSEDMMVLMYPDPSDMHRGLSPLHAALQAIDLDVDAVAWNRNLVRNGATTSTAFKFKHPLSDEQWETAIERVTEQYAGAKNAGRPWVLDSDADVESFGTSPRDMDWLESRRFNREEIFSIYSVPPPMMGVYDKATLANIRIARSIFWQDAMLPVTNRWAMVLTASLATEYGDDLWVVPDLSSVEPLQEILRTNIDAAYKLWTMGVPVSEVNRRLALGLADFPGMDIPYINAMVSPAGGEFVDGLDLPRSQPGPDEEELEAIEAGEEALAEVAEKHRREWGAKHGPDAWERALLKWGTGQAA